MAMAQTLGEIAFNQPVVTQTAKTLLLNVVTSKVADDQFRLVLSASSSDATRNKHSVTIVNPVSASVPDGSFYLVTTTDGTTAKTAAVRFATGMTQTALAAALAEVVDLHPAAAATPTATAGVLEVLAQVGGVGLTITVDCLDDGVQVSGAITTAEITPEDGTVNPFHQYAEVTVKVLTTSDLKPTLEIGGRWFNGGIVTPVPVQNFGPFPTSAPTTIAIMDALL
jgi:hypothetical protein